MVAGMNVEPPPRASMQAPPVTTVQGGVDMDLVSFAHMHHASSVALERRAAVFELRGLQERGALLGVSVVA